MINLISFVRIKALIFDLTNQISMLDSYFQKLTYYFNFQFNLISNN
jgi:hypothetical protein